MCNKCDEQIADSAQQNADLIYDAVGAAGSFKAIVLMMSQVLDRINEDKGLKAGAAFLLLMKAGLDEAAKYQAEEVRASEAS